MVRKLANLGKQLTYKQMQKQNSRAKLSSVMRINHQDEFNRIKHMLKYKEAIELEKEIIPIR